MNRNTQVLSVSLPPEVYKKIEQLSRVERKTKSQLIRDMIDEYSVSQFKKEWAEVRKIGEKVRKKYNFKTEDELFEYIHGD